MGGLIIRLVNTPPAQPRSSTALSERSVKTSTTAARSILLEGPLDERDQGRYLISTKARLEVVAMGAKEMTVKPPELPSLTPMNAR